MEYGPEVNAVVFLAYVHFKSMHQRLGIECTASFAEYRKNYFAIFGGMHYH